MTDQSVLYHLCVDHEGDVPECFEKKDDVTWEQVHELVHAMLSRTSSVVDPKQEGGE